MKVRTNKMENTMKGKKNYTENTVKVKKIQMEKIKKAIISEKIIKLSSKIKRLTDKKDNMSLYLIQMK